MSGILRIGPPVASFTRLQIARTMNAVLSVSAHVSQASRKLLHRHGPTLVGRDKRRNVADGGYWQDFEASC